MPNRKIGARRVGRQRAARRSKIIAELREGRSQRLAYNVMFGPA